MARTKRCNRCGLDKPLGEMRADSKTIDGRGYVCKACAEKLLRAWRRKRIRQIRFPIDPDLRARVLAATEASGEEPADYARRALLALLERETGDPAGDATTKGQEL